MGNRRTFGCIALKCSGPGASEDWDKRQILLTRVRWTRSGFKTLFHILNGADRMTGSEARGAWQRNCTDAELWFFASSFEDVWTSKVVPASWKGKGEDCKEASRLRYPVLQQQALRELEHREQFPYARAEQDWLAANDLSLPKGGQNSDETDWESALREFCEETGCPKNTVRQLRSEPVKARGGRGEVLHCYLVTVGAEWENEEKWAVQDSSETSEALWLPIQACHSSRLVLVKAMRSVVDTVAENCEEVWRQIDEEVCTRGAEQPREV